VEQVGGIRGAAPAEVAVMGGIQVGNGDAALQRTVQKL
jgi:hypothetical protein